MRMIKVPLLKLGQFFHNISLKGSWVFLRKPLFGEKIILPFRGSSERSEALRGNIFPPQLIRWIPREPT